MDLFQGSIVKSRAGHDKNRYFVVLKIEGDYVYLSDGKERTIENPKKKNIKHIFLTSSKIELCEMTNKKLRVLLREYGNN